MNLEAGAIIAGRYRLDRPLGEGGMGVVWAATHTVTLRRFALKFLKIPAHGGVLLRRRFEREARAASAVDHPNVVHVHDVFDCDGDTPVMVMDLLEGETLGARLRREHALPLEEAAAVLHPVVSALGTAHAAGIIHRDLKPDNIFLERHEEGPARVRVLDFGIAKLTMPDGATGTGTITGTGALLGTPVYMSPEQAMGEKDIDHRADVWALGVILYEVLSGGRPVEGDNLGQVLKRLLSDGITPLEVVVPDVPEEVTALVGRMLARDRAERPSSLAEVAAVLARYTSVQSPTFGEPRSEAEPRKEGDLLLTPQVIVDIDAREDGDTEAVSENRNDTHAATSISVVRHRARPKHYVALAAVIAGIGALAAVQLSRSPTVSGPVTAASSGAAMLPASATQAHTDGARADAQKSLLPQATAAPETASPSGSMKERAPAAPSASPLLRSVDRVTTDTPPKRKSSKSPSASLTGAKEPTPAGEAPRPRPSDPGLIDEPPF